jgi:hypothetical protein
MKPRRKRNMKKRGGKKTEKPSIKREKQARQLQESMIFLRNKVDF